MSEVASGQIRSVSGGHGLMLVVTVDGSGAAMLGHGCLHPHWFPLDQIRTHATEEIVKRERDEARARKVDCDSPDCWCRAHNLSSMCAPSSDTLR